MSDVWQSVFRAFLPAFLLVLVGCETLPPPQPPTMTTVTLTNELELAPPAPLTMPTSGPPELVVAPLPQKPVPAQHPWPSNWVNVWVPLESWGKYNQLEKLTLLKSNPHPLWQFATERGALTGKIGSRTVYWNGIECWLGYPAQMLRGVPCVHWLDAQKVLQPLLRPSPPRFGAPRTIVVDAGHGGLDSGTRSAYNSRVEKDYTLDWALRAAALLETNGWTVVLTRTRDMELSLTNRIQVADRVNADLFISLHFNSGLPNRELSGVETYCLTPTGMPSGLLRSHDEDLRLNFTNNAFDDANFQVAVRLHATILQETGAADRGVRRARFMSVLRGQNRPAVLVEGGYLSNPQEAAKIDRADYRQKLAEAVAAAVEELREE